MRYRFFVTPLLTVFLFACGGSTQGDSGGGGSEESAGISIQGVVVSDGGGALSQLIAPITKRAMPSCPDNTSGGYSFNVEPSDNSLKLAVRFVRLLYETPPAGLPEENSDYYEICTYTSTEAEENPVTIGPTATTICEVNGEIPQVAIATYSGIEMAIYWVEMTISMIVPTISDELADYQLRVYYNMAGSSTLPRDVAIYDPTQSRWAWIDTEDMSLSYFPDEGEIGEDEGRPDHVLDAFSNDEFWCADCSDTANDAVCEDYEPNRLSCGSVEHPTWSYKDPVVLSTVVGDVGGSDFRLTAPFTVSTAEETQTVTMSFDLGGGLAVWEAEGDIEDEEHTFDIQNDCGLHPTFPSVTITASESD